jgi:hypothetical protein
VVSVVPLLCPHCGRQFLSLPDMKVHQDGHLERLKGKSAFVKHVTVEDRTLLTALRIGWDEDA